MGFGWELMRMGSPGWTTPPVRTMAMMPARRVCWPDGVAWAPEVLLEAGAEGVDLGAGGAEAGDFEDGFGAEWRRVPVGGRGGRGRG